MASTRSTGRNGTTLRWAISITCTALFALTAWGTNHAYCRLSDQATAATTQATAAMAVATEAQRVAAVTAARDEEREKNATKARARIQERLDECYGMIREMKGDE